MNYFYDPLFSIDDPEFLLNESEAHHAQKVLRIRENERVGLMNGKGLIGFGLLAFQKNKSAIFHSEQFQETEISQPQIIIALANLHNRDRMEWFIEKAVEAQAHEIVLYNSTSTVKKKIDSERMLRIMISALKQSGNPWIPKLSVYNTFGEMIQSPSDGQKYIAYCPVETTRHILNAYTPAQNVQVLIGPEGDFTQGEVDEAVQHQYIPVSLGRERYRAETAALAALFMLKSRNIAL